jgi:hypothetical protein
MLASNQTISTTSSSSSTTTAAPATSATSSATNAADGFVSVVLAVTGSSSAAASVVTSSVSATGPDSSSQEYEYHDLETITTLPRTATVPWGTIPTIVSGSNEAGSVTISGTLALPPAVLPVSSSAAVFKNDTDDTQVTKTPLALYPTNSISNGSDLGVQLDSSVAPSPSLVLITYSVDPGPSVSLELPPTEGPTDGCSATTNSNTVTVWSTIYTSTITWTGDPTDYTPPYPESTALSFCSQTTGRLSVSVCDDGSCSQYTYPAATVTSDDGHRKITSTATAGTTLIGGSAAMPTITFWTTDKNPAVVYSSEAPPDYGTDGTTAVQNHNTPDGDDSTETPQYRKYTTKGQAAPTTAEADKQTPSGTPAVTVVIQTTQVIINGQTFTDNLQSKSSTVVVGGDTFTINPSQVIGAGATVARPAAGGIFIPTATTTTTVGGLQLVYGSSAATIDGTVFAIGSTPSSVVVQGQTIAIGPGGIAFPSQTIPIIKGVGVTESAVLGGQLITAIGNSLAVIDGTTFTYGPGSGTTTKVVNGDTIVVGPSGVIVHGMTLGGPAAAATATTYEIAGGATITEIGGSAVVIDGTTFLIGAGATSALTTVLDGQTLTIGPSGVAVSSYTFAQPYATSTVIQPGATSAVASATDAAENAGRGPLRPSWDLGITGMCIAIGVGFLVGLLC